MTIPADGTDPLDGGPLRHLRRIAPPWAAEDYTVCGRPIADVARVAEYDEAKALVAKWGQGRARFLFCSTCISRHDYKGAGPGRWDGNPAKITSDWAGRSTWSQAPLYAQTRAELLALADLVSAHPEEYAVNINGRLNDEVTARREARTKGRRR